MFPFGEACWQRHHYPTGYDDWYGGPPVFPIGPPVYAVTTRRRWVAVPSETEQPAPAAAPQSININITNISDSSNANADSQGRSQGQSQQVPQRQLLESGPSRLYMERHPIFEYERDEKERDQVEAIRLRQRNVEQAMMDEADRLQHQIQELENTQTHSRRQEEVRDRELARMVDRLEQSQKQRADDAERHAKKIEMLMKKQDEQRTEQESKSRFDMAELQRYITREVEKKSAKSEKGMKRDDVQALINGAVKSQLKGVATKEEVDASTRRIKKAMADLSPKGITRNEVQQAVKQEINEIVQQAEANRQKRLEERKDEEISPWRKRYETDYAFEELPDDPVPVSVGTGPRKSSTREAKPGEPVPMPKTAPPMSSTKETKPREPTTHPTNDKSSKSNDKGKSKYDDKQNSIPALARIDRSKPAKAAAEPDLPLQKSSRPALYASTSQPGPSSSAVARAKPSNSRRETERKPETSQTALAKVKSKDDRKDSGSSKAAGGSSSLAKVKKDMVRKFF